MMNKKYIMFFSLLILLAIILLGCRKTRDNTTDSLQTNSFPPGDYKFEITHDGIKRTYLLHIPQTYDDKPTPLILAFHGGMGDSTSMSNDRYYSLISKSNKEGFIIAFPNGASRLISGRFATWNAGNCCGYARDSDSDDVGFVKELLQDVESKFSIDENRVYAIGMSNGGMFSYRLACELTNEFQAIASVAGTDNFDDCNPEKPISILHIHSLNDSHVLFDGGCGPDCISGGGETEFTSVPETISNWVQRNNCNVIPIRVLEEENVYCDLYSECDGNVEVKLCVTEDGGHAWPGGEKPPRKDAATPSTALSAVDIIWDFFNSK